MTPAPQEQERLHPTAFDLGGTRLAQIYARALYDAAAAQGQVAAVVDEYGSFLHDVLDANPDFERFLDSAILGKADKNGVLRRTLEGRASPLFLHFLLVLNDHLRLGLVRAILLQFRHIRDREAHRTAVLVRTATPLAPDQERALVAKLAALVSGEPVVTCEVDPDLLAGLVVRVGDRLYDGSAATRLRHLREQLTQKAIHEIQSRRDQFCTEA